MRRWETAGPLGPPNGFIRDGVLHVLHVLHDCTFHQLPIFPKSHNLKISKYHRAPYEITAINAINAKNVI